MTLSATGHTRRRSRWWRRVGIALLAAAMLAVIGIATLVWLLNHLDRPWIKPRIQRLVSDATGLELDYSTLRIMPNSGLRLEGVDVSTPAALRAHAPRLLHVDAIELSWRLPRILSSSPKVERLVLRGVELWLIFDRSGASSLDFASTAGGTAAARERAAAPPAPLSRLLEELLGRGLPVSEVLVDPIVCRVIRTDGTARLETITLTGLKARMGTTPAEKGARAQVELGAKDAPLELELTREAKVPGRATLRLWATLQAGEGRASLALESRLIAQSLAPMPAIEHLLALELEARFSPEEARVVVLLRKLSAGGGALEASAELERTDGPASPPLLRRLHATLYPARLLALVPPELLPRLPKVAAGQLEVDLERVTLEPRPHLLAGGSARVDGQLRGISASLPGLELAARSVAIDTTLAPDESLHGHIAIDLDGASYDDPPAAVRVRAHGGRVSLSWKELRRSAEGTVGQLELSAKLTSLTTSAGALSVEATGVGFELGGALSTRPPFGADLTLRAARLRIGSGPRALLDDVLAIALHARDVRPDLAHPLASRGVLHLRGQLGPLKLSAEAKKATDTLDYDLALETPRLALADRLFDTRRDLRIAWAQMGLTLRSTGHLSSLAIAPSLKHDTTVELARPASSGVGGLLAATQLSLTAHSDGTARRHEGELALSVRELRRDHERLGDGRLAIGFAFDAQTPSLRLELSSDGDAPPLVSSKLHLGFDRASRRLAFDVVASLSRLSPLTALLANLKATRGLSLAGLELGIKAHGTLDGLIESVRADGLPSFAQTPSQASGDASLELRAAGIKWREQDRSAAIPLVTWHGTLHAAGERRALHSDLALDDLQLAFGRTRIGVMGLSDSLDITLTGDPRLGQVEVHDRMAVRGLRQELLPFYPTGALALILRSRRDRAGLVRIDELRVDNELAGTSISLAGGLDLGEERRSLSLKGMLGQDLSKLWSDTQTWIGRGSLSTEVRIDSGDLRSYRTQTAVRIKDGHIELPRQHITLDAIEGEIPVAVDLVLAKDGPRLMRNAAVNSYSELRFADQHPLQSRRSYLSIARVDTPWASIAPLAGNLVIDNNVLSLSQLELGVRGGRMSGRCAIVLQGADSKAQLSVRASGVRSSRDEPFDGNASLGISVRQHSVQGRAEILRIGRRHLLDLLDLVDPPRSDTAINRVRRALTLGYPDQVRVSFNRGFASAKITFGGIAQLLRIDEIKGIPMGPIVDRILAPFIDSEP